MKSCIGILLVLALASGCVTAKPVCETSGCSGEICSEKGKKMISPCVFLPQHECLKKSKCEAQKDGKCGWTSNEEYRACLKQFLPK